jgi:hypothetical protein
MLHEMYNPEQRIFRLTPGIMRGIFTVLDFSVANLYQ